MIDTFLKISPETILEEILGQIDLDDRDRVSNSIFAWFLTDCRKKPVPDLPQRLNKMKESILKMCQEMTFKADGTKVVLEVVGSAETTFQQLMFGSDWFTGHPRLAEFITNELFRAEL